MLARSKVLHSNLMNARCVLLAMLADALGTQQMSKFCQRNQMHMRAKEHVIMILVSSRLSQAGAVLHLFTVWF